MHKTKPPEKTFGSEIEDKPATVSDKTGEGKAEGQRIPPAEERVPPRTAETNRRKRTNPTPKKPRPFQRKGTEGRDCRCPQSGYARLARRLAPNNGNEPTKTNVFAKPNGQSRACASFAMARKRLLKTNHFVKPSAIEPARIAEARNGRKKFNVFAKPNGQSRACASRTMARNGRKKSNLNTYHLTLHQ